MPEQYSPFSDDTLRGSTGTAIPENWSPRIRGGLRNWYPILDPRIGKVLNKKQTSAGGGVTTVTQTGIPQQVLSVSATESPSRQQDRVYSLVTASFTRNPKDAAFSGVHIWFKGYKGNTQPVMMTDGADSPVSFLCEATGETVTVFVQPFAADGTPAPLAGAKSTTVSLDGQTSAPPAPTVTQTLTPIPNGVQFAFEMEGGLLADVIDGYWVYKSAANVTPTPPASRFKYIPQSTASSGTDIITFEDASLHIGDVFYFWVSAVNKQGLESALTNAQSGAVAGGQANPVEGSYAIVPDSGATCLSSTDVGGGHANISVAAFTLFCPQFPSGVHYSAGAAPLTTDMQGAAILNSTDYAVFVDDVNLAGGTQTYMCSKRTRDIVTAAGRLLIDTITTAASGGGGTGGGGTGGGGGASGCPLSGAPVRLYGNPAWWSKTVVRCEDFIEIKTTSGRTGTFSRNDRRYCRRGLLPLFQWEVGDWALTEDGEELVTSIALVHIPGAAVDRYEATSGHVYSAWGFIGHNVKLASL